MSKIKSVVYLVPIGVFITSTLMCGAITLATTPVTQMEDEYNYSSTYDSVSTPTVHYEEEVAETEIISSFSIQEKEEVLPKTVTPTPTPTPVIIEEVKPVYDFSEAEVNLLARLIHAEAGIESYECKLAVGSVVINRMLSSEYPDTIEEVIYQRKPCVQFSVIIKNSKGERPIDQKPSKSSLKAAKELTLKGTTIPKEVLVFYAEYVDSGWVTRRPKYKKIDHTIFAYLR